MAISSSKPAVRDASAGRAYRQSSARAPVIVGDEPVAAPSIAPLRPRQSVSPTEARPRFEPAPSDIAEIERATELLRRVQPALQPWSPHQDRKAAPRTPRSIFVLMSLIWAGVALATAASSYALLQLVH